MTHSVGLMLSLSLTRPFRLAHSEVMARSSPDGTVVCCDSFAVSVAVVLRDSFTELDALVARDSLLLDDALAAIDSLPIYAALGGGDSFTQQWHSSLP